MKCPYVCDAVQTNEETYEYDENGNALAHHHVLKEHKVFANCLCEECGVYRNGRCCYAAVNLENG